MEKSDLDFSHENIAEFCRRNHIRKLSVFGSFLRDDYNEDSDVDILVEFSPDHIPGLIRLAGMENELSSALGRKVSLTGIMEPHMIGVLAPAVRCQKQVSASGQFSFFHLLSQ